MFYFAFYDVGTPKGFVISILDLITYLIMYRILEFCYYTFIVGFALLYVVTLLLTTFTVICFIDDYDYCTLLH